MSRRDRVTRKKGMQRTFGRKNVNPKLSAYQKEQKRNKLANQPPIALKGHRDVPSKARSTADFMAEDKRKRAEYRARKYGDKNAAKLIDSDGNLTQNNNNTVETSIGNSSSAMTDSSNFHAPLKNVHKQNKNFSSKSEVNQAQSLNQIVAQGANLDESRVRLDLLAKKAKLRLKKKLRRRTKRSEIEEAQLDRIMNQDHNSAAAASAGKKRKMAVNGDEHLYDNNNGGDSKPVPLTRAEKKKVKERTLRREAKDLEREKQREREEKAAAAAANNNNDDDDIPVESDDDENDDQRRDYTQTDLPPEDYQLGHGDGDDDDDEDNQLQQDSASTRKKKSVNFSQEVSNNNKETSRPQQKTKTYNASTKKSFKQLDFDYVKYGDRVDAPPVLDVVPSHTLAAALDRRTRKISTDEEKQNLRAGQKKLLNNNNSNSNSTTTPHHSSSVLDKFRVADTGGQTSLSEMASKMVAGRHRGSSDIFQIQQKTTNNNNNNSGNNSNDSFLSKSVSGAKLQGKEDFEALREKVMESYAKHHPKAFGKARTYSRL